MRWGFAAKVLGGGAESSGRRASFELSTGGGPQERLKIEAAEGVRYPTSCHASYRHRPGINRDIEKERTSTESFNGDGTRRPNFNRPGLELNCTKQRSSSTAISSLIITESIMPTKDLPLVQNGNPHRQGDLAIGVPIQEDIRNRSWIKLVEAAELAASFFCQAERSFGGKINESAAYLLAERHVRVKSDRRKCCIQGMLWENRSSSLDGIMNEELSLAEKVSTSNRQFFIIPFLFFFIHCIVKQPTHFEVRRIKTLYLSVISWHSIKTMSTSDGKSCFLCLLLLAEFRLKKPSASCFLLPDLRRQEDLAALDTVGAPSRCSALQNDQELTGTPNAGMFSEIGHAPTISAH
ncbi:hypothetical protein EJB05_27442, partial [Eragrostis curvula]